MRSTVTSALEVRLQTISQEILSRARLEEMITRFGLYQDLKKQAPMETVIEQMRRDVKIESKGKEDRATVAFAVSYRGREAQKVALVANALAAAYIEENLKMRERQATGTADFMRVQLDDLAKKLAEMEKKVGEFKARHIGELPEQLNANLQGLEQLNTQLRLNAENMTRATERRGNLERELTALLGTTGAGPQAPAIRLAQLKGTLAALQTRYSDKHPEVQRIKSEIATLEAAIGAGGGEGAAGAMALPPQVQQLKSALSEAEVQIKGLEAEAANLKRQLTIYQARVESVPRVQQEYQAMSREYETTQEMYKSMTVRQRESALSERMEQRQKGEQFRVIEPALVAEEPAAPKRPRLFALVLAPRPGRGRRRHLRPRGPRHVRAHPRAAPGPLRPAGARDHPQDRERPGRPEAAQAPGHPGHRGERDRGGAGGGQLSPGQGELGPDLAPHPVTPCPR